MVGEMKEDFLINIVADRESVSMGDDIEAHKKIIKVATSSNPVTFIKRVIEQYELPAIAGVNHTWDCLLNEILIVSIKGNSIEFNAKVAKINFQENNKIFFKYNADLL